MSPMAALAADQNGGTHAADIVGQPQIWPPSEWPIKPSDAPGRSRTRWSIIEA